MFYDFLNYGKTHTRAAVFQSFVQPLKDHKNPIQMTGFDPDAIVLE